MLNHAYIHIYNPPLFPCNLAIKQKDIFYTIEYVFLLGLKVGYVISPKNDLPHQALTKLSLFKANAHAPTMVWLTLREYTCMILAV